MNTDTLSSLDLALEAIVNSQSAEYAVDNYLNIFLNTQFFTVFEDESTPRLIADPNTKQYLLTLFQSEEALNEHLNNPKALIQSFYGDEIIRYFPHARIGYLSQGDIRQFNPGNQSTLTNCLTTNTTYSIINFNIDNNAINQAESTLFDRYKADLSNTNIETLAQTLINSVVYVPLKPQAILDDLSRRDFFIVNKTMHVDSDHIAVFDRRDRLEHWREINHIDCKPVRMHVNMLLWYLKPDEGLLINYNQKFPLYYRPDDLFMIRKHCNITEYTFTQKQSYSYMTLPEAAEVGNLKAVEFHVENGVPLTTCVDDKFGNMAIHLAAMKGYYHVLEYLISQGCPPNIKQNFGWEPIHFACYHGHPQIVDFLLKINVDIEQPNGYGFRPLHLVAEMGYYDIVTRLLTAGADINAAQNNEFGTTALHLAASNDHFEVVQTLLASGANINYRDKYGWSPLMYAASSGHGDIAKMLIQSGAEKNYQEISTHYTAAILASNAGFHDVAQLIKQPLHVV